MLEEDRLFFKNMEIRIIQAIKPKRRFKDKPILYSLLDKFVEECYTKCNNSVVPVGDFKAHFASCNNQFIGQKTISAYMRQRGISFNRFSVNHQQQKCWIGLKQKGL